MYKDTSTDHCQDLILILLKPNRTFDDLKFEMIKRRIGIASVWRSRDHFLGARTHKSKKKMVKNSTAKSNWHTDSYSYLKGILSEIEI